MTSQPIRQYLTPQQLCEYLNGSLSPRTLANWRSSNQRPRYVKVEGKVLYPVSSVTAWLSERTMQGTGSRE
ncbi:TPA: helix-turn-helix domain-containing protein [Klebsiella pneumoniae]|uniref:helix-turn-helix domain-containing protein n=1 Tax=Klebsiella pneumoniae TaxID=573 RepID=UPI0035C9D860|nr:helix-turn-helix domain-containing protein [Klebsiella pneumoniae]